MPQMPDKDHQTLNSKIRERQMQYNHRLKLCHKYTCKSPHTRYSGVNGDHILIVALMLGAAIGIFVSEPRFSEISLLLQWQITGYSA